jgi:Flp pilus assembly protein TadD
VTTLALVTAVRSADYRSEVALWEAARRSAPQKVRVLSNLGVTYLDAKRWDEARAVLSEAASLAPNDEIILGNLYDAEQHAGPAPASAPQTQPW